MDVSVIIVSYNTADLTLVCLASLKAAAGNKEIFVVDNASTDDSVSRIRESFPEVRLIVNETNRGFAAANNQALPLCCGHYIVYLNPDTAVKPDALTLSVAFMDDHVGVGLAGAKILNPDGSLQPSVSYRYPGEKHASGETAGLTGHIACVLGAFMIVRRELICELNGFDEDFFLYGEDQDLCWRVRQRGFAIGYIEEARVFHWGGQSEENTPRPAVFEKKLRAEYLFYGKHYRPETISHIKRAEALKAKYRLLSLRLTGIFTRDTHAHADKITCYRIALALATF